MNTKHIIFWIFFLLILALIVWGLAVAMNKAPKVGPGIGTPSEATSTDHILGPANVPVTIIEYSDFQCPACALYYPIIERLTKEASTTVRFVYRHFPLFPLPHKNSIFAAQASEAASKQGKFWDMYKLLFENQTVWQDSNTASAIFEGYAESLNLDMTAYKKDFGSAEIKARIQRDRDEGDTLGVNSTPTFFVNGKVIVNPQGYEQFKALIDATASGGAK
ncbi:MAG: thioredoxin domain-containing protein [Patescibacteria group bacterium]